MAYCVKCGEKVDDTVVTCPFCGAVIPGKESKTQEDSSYTYGNSGSQSSSYTYGENAQNTYNAYGRSHTMNGYFPESEIRSNKVMAVLCYLGVLVFVPVLAGDKQSEYLKLHKNQGMILFIVEMFLNVVERYRAWSAGIFAWFAGGAVDVGVDIARFVVLILFIMGIVYACRGEKKELPGIGRIKIFR